MFTISEKAAKRYEVLSTPGLGVGILCKEGVDEHADNTEYGDLTSGIFQTEMSLRMILNLVANHEDMYHGD